MKDLLRINLAWCVVVMWALGCGVSHAQEKLKSQEQQDGVRWFDIRQLGVEGQGWVDNKAPFDRLPAKAESKVRDKVWDLSRDSAGMCVRFITDATAIDARWTLTKAKLEMPHMAATGVSGVDLYAKDDRGRWRWVSVGRPTDQTNLQKLAHGIAAGKREYLLYLPLYNGVSSVEVGVPTAHAIEKAAVYPMARAKPIVFYGTSITHGACASRPGMVHTAILGRQYGRPIINLGFSGKRQDGTGSHDIDRGVGRRRLCHRLLPEFGWCRDSGADQAAGPAASTGAFRNSNRPGRGPRLRRCLADRIEAVA